MAWDLTSAGKEEMKNKVEEMITLQDFDGLIKALDYPSRVIQERAEEGLIAFGRKAVAPLIRALKGNDDSPLKDEILSEETKTMAIEPLVDSYKNEAFIQKLSSALDNIAESAKTILKKEEITLSRGYEIRLVVGSQGDFLVNYLKI
jgi:hypothetical protein